MGRKAKQITLIFKYGNLRFEAVVDGPRTRKGDWVSMDITKSPHETFSFFDAAPIHRTNWYGTAKTPEKLAKEIVEHCEEYSEAFVDNVTADTFADVLTLVESAGERKDA